MEFATPLVRATLLKRYKRFLADVRLADGTETTAHCPNPGAMTGLADPGAQIWLERAKPGAKLDWGWRLTELEDGMACVDTGRANKVVAAALEARAVPALGDYATVRPEVPYAEKSRVDFLLSGAGADHYVEVKSVTLRRSGQLAEFPDSVTARGARHLADLAAMVRAGHRATLLYLVMRDDCDHVGVAADIDPTYAHALDTARTAGVEVMALGTIPRPEGISVTRALPVTR